MHNIITVYKWTTFDDFNNATVHFHTNPIHYSVNGIDDEGKKYYLPDGFYQMTEFSAVFKNNTKIKSATIVNYCGTPALLYRRKLILLEKYNEADEPCRIVFDGYSC